MKPTSSYIRNVALGLSVFAVLAGGLVAKLALSGESVVPAKVAISAMHVLQVADGQETHGKTGG